MKGEKGEEREEGEKKGLWGDRIKMMKQNRQEWGLREEKKKRRKRRTMNKVKSEI